MSDLVLALLQTGGASAVALVLGVITTKVFALALGPAGVGLVSLVRQTYQTAVVLSSINGQTALAQGIASSEGEVRVTYLSTVFWILLIAGAAGAVVFLVFPTQIALIVAGRRDPSTSELMRLLGPAILMGVGSVFVMGILTGHRAVGRIAMLQIAGAAVGAVLAYPVAKLFRLGYVSAVVLQIFVPAMVIVGLGIRIMAQAGWLPKTSRGVAPLVDRSAGLRFLGLAVAMLLSGFLAPAIPLAVRAIIIRRFGLSGVGVFDVAWNVSTNYVLVVVASFGTYYVPTLSRLKSAFDRERLIHQVLRVSMLVGVPLILTTIVLKPLIVRVLYSPQFLPALEIMRWMLIGDYFKITSWVFAFTMVAFADVQTILWTEVVWGAVHIAGAAAIVHYGGALEGVGANFVFVYGTYLAFTYVYVVARKHFRVNAPIALTWTAGLLLIVAASAQTWVDRTVRPAPVVAFLGAATCFCWAAVTTDERRKIRTALALLFRRWAPTSLQYP